MANGIQSSPFFQDLLKLISQQQDFIKGIQPFSIGDKYANMFGGGGNSGGTGGYDILSSAFEPTLTDLLQTGGKVDVSGATEAAKSEAQRFFNQQQGQAAERGAAGFLGGAGSSAQTAAIARALAEASTRVGETGLRAQVAADESAQGRRLGALGQAIAEGQLRLGERDLGVRGAGLDIEAARLGLQGRTGQSGAGQDLINALLSGLPMSNQGPSLDLGGGGIPAPQLDLNSLLSNAEPSKTFNPFLGLAFPKNSNYIGSMAGGYTGKKGTGFSQGTLMQMLQALMQGGGQ